ncbi:hypothetical protein, partial [Mesorhizobium sp.]|uniref:hypothetical protein n=1 Tax=Mesorhizobium sp. TaxID=1871066 RepID=UPI0025B9B609
TGLISFLAVTFLRWTTFGVVVVRTTFGAGAGSGLGITVVHPATARAPDRIAATTTCFKAQPTTFASF